MRAELEMRMRRMVAVGVVLVLGACGKDGGGGVATQPDSGGADVATMDVAPDVGPDSSPDVAEGPPQMVVDPSSLTFRDVRQGDSVAQKVGVTNLGTGPLFVLTAEVVENNRMGNPELVPGEGWASAFTVDPGTFRELEVVYRPHDFGTDTGELRLQTNDPTQQVVIVRLETVNAYSDIDGPQLLNFGTVAGGDESTERVILKNLGLDSLTISDVEIGGISTEFGVTFEPTAVPPTVLETGEEFVMDVRYAPLNADTDRGTVIVHSDDPDEPTFEVALVGNNPGRCLRAVPPAVDFGSVEAGTRATRDVTFLNCSTELAVEISALELVDDGGGAFAIESVPTLPLTLVPLQTASLGVSAGVDTPGVATGSIAVTSDDTTAANRIDLRVEAPERM